MAKYDQGGGCACGLNRVCDCMGPGRIVVRNELLEAVIEQEFDGDRSGLICFVQWLEFRVAGLSECSPHTHHHDMVRRIRQTYADWLLVQAGAMK